MNKYEHLYVFGCSHSLNTNSIDNTCKSYSDLLANKLGIPTENVYNYAINGSSNTENLFYLNSLYGNIKFVHPNDDIKYNKYGKTLPRKLHNNSLIIFQLTYWHRIAFQHSILKKNGINRIVPFGPYKQFDKEPPFYDKDLTTFCDIYYNKLSHMEILETNLIVSLYHILKNINNENNTINSLLLSWDSISTNVLDSYISKNLNNLQQLSIDKGWTCHSELNNKDWHLSPTGNKEFSEYLYLQM